LYLAHFINGWLSPFKYVVEGQNERSICTIFITTCVDTLPFVYILNQEKYYTLNSWCYIHRRHVVEDGSGLWLTEVGSLPSLVSLNLPGSTGRMTRIYFAISFGIKGCHPGRLSSLRGWICYNISRKSHVAQDCNKTGLVVDQQVLHVAAALDFNVKGFFKLGRSRLSKGSIRFLFPWFRKLVQAVCPYCASGFSRRMNESFSSTSCLYTCL
jgi:hypothetical protein